LVENMTDIFNGIAHFDRENAMWFKFPK